MSFVCQNFWNSFHMCFKMSNIFLESKTSIRVYTAYLLYLMHGSIILFSHVLAYRCIARSTKTHLSQVPHVYASVNWISIDSDNDLLPVRRQTIAWDNASLLSIGPSETNCNYILNRNSNILVQENALERCLLWNGVHFVPEKVSLENSFSKLQLCMIIFRVFTYG